MKYSVIIPASGKGTRLNLGYNKVLFKNDGEYLIQKTLKNFVLDMDCLEIILVHQKDEEIILKEIVKDVKVKFVFGGCSREESVLNGLKMVNSEFVLIHDGARPNINKELINRVKERLEKEDSVIPVVKLKEASLINDEYHGQEINVVQTPQGFKTTLLLEAMNNVNLDNFRDEGSIYSFFYKKKINIVDGDYANIKVTTKEDLKYIK